MFLPAAEHQEERQLPSSLSSNDKAFFDCLSHTLKTISNKRFVWYYDFENSHWSVGYLFGEFRDGMSVICRILDNSEEHGTLYLIQNSLVQEISRIPSNNFGRADLLRNFRYICYTCGSDVAEISRQDYFSVWGKETWKTIKVKRFQWNDRLEPQQVRIRTADSDKLFVVDTNAIRLRTSDLLHEFVSLKPRTIQMEERLREMERLHEGLKKQLEAATSERNEFHEQYEMLLSDLNRAKEASENWKRSVEDRQRSEQQFKERLGTLRQENQTLKDKNGQLREKIATIMGNSHGVTYVDSKMWDCATILKKLVSLRKQEHEQAVMFLDDTLPNQSDETYYMMLWKTFHFVNNFYRQKCDNLFNALCMSDINMHSIFISQIQDNFEGMLDLDGLEADAKRDLPFGFERNDPLWKFMESCARLCWAVLLQHSPKMSFFPVDQDPRVPGDEFVELDTEKHLAHPMCRVKYNSRKIVRVTQYVLPGLFHADTLEPISNLALPYVFTIHEDRCLAESMHGVEVRPEEHVEAKDPEPEEKSKLELTRERVFSVRSELERLVNENSRASAKRAMRLLEESNIDFKQFSIQFNCQNCGIYYDDFKECVKYLIECQHCGCKAVYVNDVAEIGRGSI